MKSLTSVFDVVEEPGAESSAAVDLDPSTEVNEALIVETTLNGDIVDVAASLAVTALAQLHVIHAWDAISDRMIKVSGNKIREDEAARNRNSKQRDQQSRLGAFHRRMQKHSGSETQEYLAPRFCLREGAACRVVPDVAEELNANLVVMGMVSRTDIPGLLIGNTAQVILKNLECAVLAVKPDGLVTPASR